MNKIKFSHKYSKLECDALDGFPPWATLLDVFNGRFEDLSEGFKRFDGHYKIFRKQESGQYLYNYYPFPKKGDCLVLLFQYGDLLFTTVRKRTDEKEKYYRENIGTEFEVVIE